MTLRPAVCLTALAATLLSACGSTPGMGAEPASSPTPVLYTRSLSGAAAAAEIRAALDPADLVRLGQLLERSGAEPGRWKSARSGHDLLVTPQKTFAGNHGGCREFSIDATRGGVTERWRGAACQQADTRWQLLSQ